MALCNSSLSTSIGRQLILRCFLTATGLGLLFIPSRASAMIGIPGDSGAIEDLFREAEAMVTETFTKPFTKGLGLALEHRAYRPATALGKTPGLELGIEGTIVKPPEEFGELTGGGDSLPVLPSGKVHIAKGFGQNVDIGVSGIWYLGNLVIGGHIQAMIFNPPEGGFTWAARLNYTRIHLKQDPMTLKLDVISPQLLVSRKMSFADPYAGVGYQSVGGKLSMPVSLDDSGLLDPVTLTSSTRIHNFTAFTGVSMVLGPSGILLVMEMAYSYGGMPSMGAKVGLSF